MFKTCIMFFVFPSARGPPVKVLAFAGRDVVLPCSFSVTPGNHFPDVEWSKEGLQPNVVFLYRDGCETHEMKNPAFLYRTSLITEELKNGNISLRISNVQLSDAGKYQCMRLWEKSSRDFDTVELVVGSSSLVCLFIVQLLQLHFPVSIIQKGPSVVDGTGSTLLTFLGFPLCKSTLSLPYSIKLPKSWAGTKRWCETLPTTDWPIRRQYYQGYYLVIKNDLQKSTQYQSRVELVPCNEKVTKECTGRKVLILVDPHTLF